MLQKLLVLLFVFCAADAGAQGRFKRADKITEKAPATEIDYKQVGAPMPSLMFIPFYDSTSKVKEKDRKQLLTNKDFDNGANLIVMMFNPTCSHCQEQTILMGANDTLFKKTKVMLMANLIMKPYLADFLVFTHADEHAFMHLGVDSAGFINNLFLYQSLPQINIYDAERKLIKTYTGSVPIDTLKKYIQ